VCDSTIGEKTAVSYAIMKLHPVRFSIRSLINGSATKSLLFVRRPILDLMQFGSAAIKLDSPVFAYVAEKTTSHLLICLVGLWNILSAKTLSPGFPGVFRAVVPFALVYCHRGLIVVSDDAGDTGFGPNIKL
jgi:hypothetical protein